MRLATRAGVRHGGGPVSGGARRRLGATLLLGGTRVGLWSHDMSGDTTLCRDFFYRIFYSQEADAAQIDRCHRLSKLRNLRGGGHGGGVATDAQNLQLCCRWIFENLCRALLGRWMFENLCRAKRGRWIFENLCRAIWSSNTMKMRKQEEGATFENIQSQRTYRNRVYVRTPLLSVNVVLGRRRLPRFFRCRLGTPVGVLLRAGGHGGGVASDSSLERGSALFVLSHCTTGDNQRIVVD